MSGFFEPFVLRGLFRVVLAACGRADWMTMRKFSKHTPEQIVVKLEKADAWPLVSSRAYQRVPSPKSLAGARPYASGRTPSWPTSTQEEPATAPPKLSTESSN